MDQWEINEWMIIWLCTLKKKIYFLRLIMKKSFNNFNIWNTIENNWKNLYITVFILVFVWCWYIQVLFYFKFCLIYIFYCSLQNNPKMPLSYCSVFSLRVIYWIFVKIYWLEVWRRRVWGTRILFWIYTQVDWMHPSF